MQQEKKGFDNALDHACLVELELTYAAQPRDYWILGA
jgi:hypothetical protein